MNTSERTEGVAISMVKILNEYSQAIPVAFLARLLGRSIDDVREYIRILEKKEIVETNNGNVRLRVVVESMKKGSAQVAAR